MNIKKMFTVLSGVIVAATMVMPSASVLGASYSQELQDAYNWAHDKGITTMSTIDNANMYGAITRAEMAKMLSVYATKVLGKTADTSKTCRFTDTDSVNSELRGYITESCQLGIMGQ
jgi:predicted transcriptional regulator